MTQDKQELIAPDNATKRSVTAALGFCAALLFGYLASPWGGFWFHGDTHWFAAGLAWSFFIGGSAAALGAPITGLLIALLFAGGLSQLWFTERDWYSALRMHAGSPADILMLGILGGEGAVAVYTLVWRFGFNGLMSGIRALGTGRVLIVLAASALATVTLSQELGPGFMPATRYALKVALGGELAFIHIFMLAAILSAPDLPRLWRGLPERAAAMNALPLWLAAMVLAGSGLMAWLAFRGMGLVEDETAYLFQAKTFAAGRLMAPPLASGTAEAFSYYLLQSTPSGWYATTAPGWPALLALGVAAGVPLLVNPLLGAGAVWMLHRLVLRHTGERWTANVAALMMAASPWLLETSASLMTHALSIALILGAWLLLTSSRDSYDEGKTKQSSAMSFVAGLLLGWLFVNRQLEGVVVGVLSGLWLLGAVRLRGWLVVAAFGLGCMATGALLLLYNAHFTGDPLHAPLAAYLTEVWHSTHNDFGFGPHVGPPPEWSTIDVWPGHSPLEGLVNLIDGVRALNVELFGWSAGSLLLIWFWLAWGRKDRFAWAMAIVVATIIGIHFFYWFNAIFYIGPRYWYASLPGLVVLAALGARELADRLGKSGMADSHGRVAATVVITMLFALSIFTPWRAIYKYSARAAAGAAIEDAARHKPEFANAIVFLSKKDYHDAAILNDPLLRAPAPIFVIDRGAARNAALLRAWPGRHGLSLAVEGKKTKSVSVHAVSPPPGQND